MAKKSFIRKFAKKQGLRSGFELTLSEQLKNSQKNERQYSIRKSLRTRERKKALIRARYLWILMENINKRYFKSAEIYSRAMKLLYEYDSIQFENWNVIEQRSQSYIS